MFGFELVWTAHCSDLGGDVVLFLGSRALSEPRQSSTMGIDRFLFDIPVLRRREVEFGENRFALVAGPS